MSLAATLDHVVINARDDLAGAAALYRRLGFALSPQGRHTLGTVNHLAIFGTDYLELIGAPPGRDDLAPMAWPPGLNAVVFGTEDAAATHTTLRAAGIAAGEPLAFSRPLDTPEGPRDVAFRIILLPDGTVPGGRAYFCQHLSRSLVWRDDERRHPNSVVGVDSVLIAARSPGAAAASFAAMFGPDAVAGIEGGVRLACGLTRVEVLAPSAAAERLGEPVAVPDGASALMAGLVLRTGARARAAAAIQSGGIALREDGAGRVVVPAAEAGGVVLVFDS